MKKSFFLYTVAFFTLVVLVFYFFIYHTESFKRRQFTIVEPVSRVDTGGIDVQMETQSTENIHSGKILKFEKKGVLSLKPNARGKKGIFFTFQVKTRDLKKVKTSLFLKRKGRLLKLKIYSGRSYYHSFSREFEFLKGDEFRIEVQGNGIIVVNKPVVFNISENKKRKYVFVIALDTLRYDKVGIKKNGIPLTPHISEFREDCCGFSNAYAQSSWTLPSFMSFFTGLYEFNHQITRETALPEDKPFLVEDISEKFFTVNFNAGLWLKGKFGFSRGFDFFSVFSSPTDSLGGQVLFSKAIEFLQKTSVPSLFMFLHTYQVHSPYSPPENFLSRWSPHSGFKELDSFFYKKQFRKDVSKDIRLAMEELYEAEVLAFDHFFREFINKLKEMDIYNRSMIVFLSDHGEEFYEHGGWAHCHSLYNEVIKVPLFIKFPNNEYKGRVIDENVGLIDILPSVMDYYGVKKKSTVDGLSVLPLLENKKLDRDKIFSSTSVAYLVKNIPPKFSIINKRFKLIYNFKYSPEDHEYFSEFGFPPESGMIQVFDLNVDEQELISLDVLEMQRQAKSAILDAQRIGDYIQVIMKTKRKKNIHMTLEDKKRLESLGYM